MAEERRMKLSAINDILPPEIIEKVLKLLNYKDTNQARLICRRRRQIIDNGKLVKKASGKIQSKTMHSEHFLGFTVNRSVLLNTLNLSTW